MPRVRHGQHRKKDERRSAVWGGKGVALFLVVLSSTLAFGHSPKLSRELQGAHSGSMVDVIVQFKQHPTAYHFNKVTDRGGRLNRDLSGSINGASFRIPASALANLVKDGDVAYVSIDHRVHATSSGSSGPLTLDYYDDTVNADYAANMGIDGSGIGVALIDSGTVSVPDLGTTVVYSQDFTGAGDATDEYGHGTHVAGILAGSGKNSSGYRYFYTFQGIAPNANIINLRVLDDSGSGSDSQVISAINRAIALKSKYNIRVINLSLGRPVYESYKLDPLCQAVEKAWKAGIVVVVAAGNDGRNNSYGTNGYGTITAPGNDPYVITVGAMKTMGTPSRADDLIASYSSKGPTLLDHVVKPDLVAPGNRITSLYKSTMNLAQQNPGNEVPYSLYQRNGNNSHSTSYYQLSGTSMAAPMVSGTVALMLDQNPSLTPDQIKARLMKTASKNFPHSSTAVDPDSGNVYTSQYDMFTVGAGYLDVQAALSSTDLAPSNTGSASSPSVAVDASGNVYLVSSDSVVWGNSVIWGNSVVWGTSVVWGNLNGESILSGSSVCWGASNVQGYSVIWGNSVVWGSSDDDDNQAYSVSLVGEN